MRKRRVATAAVTAAMIGIMGFSSPVYAAAGYGAAKAELTKGSKTVTIGNDAITRTFSFKDGKLKTEQIQNKLGNTTITPGGGSEEFYLEGLIDPTRQEPSAPLTSVKPTAQPSGNVQVSGSSVDNSEGNHPANLAIDGDAATYWVSNAHNDPQNPTFDIDFGKTARIASLVYTPRWDATAQYACTGQILELEVQKKDGNAWTSVKTFTLKESGEACKDQKLNLDTPVETSAIRLVVKKSYHWQQENKNKFANIAEIDVLNAEGTSLIHGAAQGAWSVETTSDQGTNDGGGINALIDGDTGSYWHSRYNANGVTGEANKMPIDVTLDRGTAAPAFATLGYFPRATSANGNWQEFELYASDTKEGLFSAKNQLKATNDSTTFKVSYAGMYGSGTEAGAKWNYFGLKDACAKRYVGIRVTKGQGGSFAAGGEIDLFSGDPFTSCETGNAPKIKTSDLTLAGDPVISDTVQTVNGEKKSGKLITFAFEPFTFGGDSKATLEQKVVMFDGDHFMRKWLEFKTSDKTTRVKFIDGEHIQVADDVKTWTAPRDKGGVVAMDMEKSILGQPVYLNGMFLGSEFPETDTQVVEQLARPRYWTGKSFTDFERDGQLTKDGEFVSWQTVCGATHSDGSDMNVIQTDFYAYITSISKPSDFRIQYNSWFDNMMFIDDENIIESFKAVDKQLSETGVRPLESYVVDDGWNQYRKTADQYLTGDDLRRNGAVEPNELGVNNSGFWQFNNKFPNGLTPSSSLVRKLGSSFGVWIGPRGGYNYYGNLASIIADAGKGSSAGGSIDVADQRYVDNFADMATKWMEDYGVNYWKWDGYADSSQFNAFKSGEDYAAYNEDHQHMEGGPSHYFHVTDLWEKWIVLFDRVWDTASAEQIEDLWISLTCYVNPSPWFLQWSNSVWMQCVGDRGEVHNGTLNDKMNTMLTYRDACYYDFIKNHEFQFPLANLYNHDPIYGKEGTGITADSMDGEQFRNYLFMQGTRGTAFWELYYSDSLFNDEKYLINADFLAWEEGNFDMLRNAKWVGGTPSSTTVLSSSPTSHNPGEQNAYGFAGFNAAGDEGIISMRNPGTTALELAFKLDAGIGCTSEGTYHVVRDHVYTEGDAEAAQAPKTLTHGQDVSITLQPGEVQIWHLSKEGDTKAPTLAKIYTENNATLRVQTSEHVYGATFEVLVGGKKVELAQDAVRAYADLKTFDITLPQVPADGAQVEVKATAGADAAGNALAGSLARVFHVDGVLAGVHMPATGNLAPASNSIEGVNGFAVAATVSTPAPGTVLVSQGEEWSLGINAEGHAYFTVGGVTATSESKVEGSMSLVGVRENNGMLKMYCAGEIDGNAYDAKQSVGHEVKAAAITVNASANLLNATVYDRSLGYDEVPATPLADLVKTVKAAQGKVSSEAWAAGNLDALLAQAEEALKGGDAAAQQRAYEELLAAYNALVPGASDPKVENLALGKVPTASWLPGSTASGDPTNSGSPLTIATDGKHDATTPYAIFGRDDAKQPAYMQIDLGETAAIERVKLWRYWADGRQYADTALVVSETPDFEQFEVLYYSYADASKKDVFGLGEDATAELYTETAEGKELFGANSKPVNARYVRLYGNGRIGGIGGDNHVVELEVEGTRTVTLGDPYGVALLDALIEGAKAAVANEKAYTAESIKALKAELEKAQALSDKIHEEIDSQVFTVTFGEFNAVRDGLQNALAHLVRTEDPGEVDPPTPPTDPEGPITPEVPQQPENPADPSKPSKPQTGAGLPSTGDASFVMVAGVAAVAVVALGAGVCLKRRRG